MKLHHKLEFLTSTRFYAGVLDAIGVYLAVKGWAAEGALLSTLSTLFITVRTVDRHTDKMAEATAMPEVNRQI